MRSGVPQQLYTDALKSLKMFLRSASNAKVLELDLNKLCYNISNVFVVVWLRIPLLWDMMLYLWVTGSHHVKEMLYRNPHCLDMQRSDYPDTGSHLRRMESPKEQ
jgi:hypothetical protein